MCSNSWSYSTVVVVVVVVVHRKTRQDGTFIYTRVKGGIQRKGLEARKLSC